MSVKKNLSIESLNIDGVLVRTASAQVKTGTKSHEALAALTALENEHQIIKRCSELTIILMRELKIREDKNLVGFLCCEVARSNFEEVKNWVMLQTASLKNIEELYELDLVHELTRKLYSALMEYDYAD